MNVQDTKQFAEACYMLLYAEEIIDAAEIDDGTIVFEIDDVLKYLWISAMEFEFDNAKEANVFFDRFCLASGGDIYWVLSKMPSGAYLVERTDEGEPD